MQKTIQYVAPVKGAAEYFAGLDADNGFKPSVFMTDDEGYTSVIDSAKTIELARIKAIKWQIKENTAVLKSQSKN